MISSEANIELFVRHVMSQLGVEKSRRLVKQLIDAPAQHPADFDPFVIGMMRQVIKQLGAEKLRRLVDSIGEEKARR